MQKQIYNPSNLQPFDQNYKQTQSRLFIMPPKLMRRVNSGIIINYNIIKSARMLSYSGSPRSSASSTHIKLSEALLRSGLSQKSQILKLQRQQITYIDNIQFQTLKNIEQLNLSHNSIKRLANINQFSCLKTLDISYNQIKDCMQLLNLKEIQTLQTIKMEGNPFLNLAINLQTLIFLSNKNVDIDFREQEQEKIAQYNTLENYLQLIFMQYANKLLDLQIQYSKKFNNKTIQDTNINYLMQSRNVFKHFDCTTKNQYLQSLKFQAYDIKERQGISLLESYKQIQSLQNNQKISLLKSLTEKSINLNRIKKKKSQSTPRKSLSPLQNFQLTQDTVKMKQTPSFNTLPFSKTQKKLISKMWQSQNKYQQKYHKNLPKLNPVYNLLYSPINSLKPNEKDLLIENLSQDLKRMTIALYTKEEQADDKQQEMNAKFRIVQQELEQLKGQNADLKQILQQRQNQIAMCRVDKDIIFRLQLGMKNKSEQIQQMGIQIQNYQDQLQKLQGNLLQLQQYEQTEELIRTNHNQQVKRSCMHMLKTKFQKMVNFKKSKEQNNIVRAEELKYLIFHHLKTTSQNNRKLQKFTIKKYKQSYINFFKQLKTVKNLQTKEKQVRNLVKKNKFKLYISFFQKTLINTLYYKKLKAKSVFHFQSSVLRKSFKILKMYWVKYNSSAYKSAMEQVRKHYECKLKVKAIEGFLFNQQVEVKTRQQALNHLDQVYQRQQNQNKKLNHKLLKQERKRKLQILFETAWKYNIRKRCDLQLKEYYLVSTHQSRKMKSFINALKVHSKKYLGYKKQKLIISLKQMSIRAAMKDFSNILGNQIRCKRIIHRNLVRNLVKKQYQAFHFLKTAFVNRRIQEAPRIDILEYECRQAQLTKLNELLKLQVQAKDQQTKLYHQKISQLQFSVTSQQIKYQQLLAVHEGSVLEMRSREAQLLQLILRLQGHKQYIPIAEMKDDLKRARIFSHNQRNNVYKNDF